MAYTNLKILNYYKPDYYELSSIGSHKNYPTEEAEEKFRKYWNKMFDIEIEGKGDRFIIEKRKKNVHKYNF